ncbi:calcium homeostasis modulator protein 6-like [Oculina patagonica]
MAEAPPVYPSFSQLASGGISYLKDNLKKVALPLQNAAITGVVLGLKEFLNKLVFKCPERYYKLYSMMFIFVPAVLLFCFALIISRSFWKMMAGCCRLPRSRWRVVWQRSRKFVYLCSLPPFAWLLFALFDTKYYVCAKLGSLEVRLNKTAPLEQQALLADYESANTESQIIAFLLLSVTVLVSTMVISLDRCCSRAETGIGDDQEYVHYLAEEEIKLFNLKLEPLAKEQAKAHVDALFEKHKDIGDAAERIRQISKDIVGEFPWATTYEA